MIIAVIVLGILVLVMGALLLRGQNSKDDTGNALLLKADMTELNKSMESLRESMQKSLTDQMGASNKQMAAQFSASSKIIEEVTRNLTELKESNKQVMGITDELKTLQNVLQNPKQRGVLGEYYLDQVLRNVLTTDRYKLQYKIGKDDDGKDLIPDAVILLDKGLMLPVDSKFSLENYNRLVESKDKVERESLVKLFKNDLKNRIDETSKYVRPKDGTMDYAFMFIPSEAIYYDLLVNKVGTTGTSARDLIEYAFREKNVIIVSPTTFMAYLQTVLQGLRALQIEGQAKEIQQRVGELGRHIATYETYMQKLGGSLGTTVNNYNTAHKELKKIDKDVIKIADTSPSVEPLLLDRPNIDTD
jgi:DNA recombination protein RmuC